MGHFKVRKLLLKPFLVVLTVVFIFCSIGSNQTIVDGIVSVASEKAEESKGDTADIYSYQADEFVSEKITSAYTKISEEYTMPMYQGNDMIYQMKEVVSEEDSSHLTKDTKDYPDADEVVDLSLGEKVSLNIFVPEDGRYYVLFNYYSYDESVLPIAAGFQVDQEYPFYECRNLIFETTWLLNPDPSYDRYNNQVVTVPHKALRWEQKHLKDASYRHSKPLMVELAKGEHELELEVKEGNFLLGNLLLQAPYEVEPYTGSDIAEGNGLIELEGENFAWTNSSSIHGVAEYDTSLTPYEVKDTVLNTIDSESFLNAGQSITYEFEAETSGFYNIAMNYRQSDKTDFVVFLDIMVDGKIPNERFQSYGMAYTTKYKTTTLSDQEGNHLSVYLEKGIHTISYTISMDAICYIMEGVDEIMSGVNDLALEITKVAGTNADKYRDLKLTRYIPDLEKTLYEYVDALYELEKSAIIWSDSEKSVAVMSSMLIAAKQLKSLADHPDEIPYRIGELSTSMNSVNHYLALVIDQLIKNNLAIDRIWIYQNGVNLPKNPGFFKSCKMNLNRFVASFASQAYSASNTDPQHLQVWVNRSSQYVQIMQKMIDESFTPATGIEVDISIMPDQYKLVLANSSGNAPDVATGINYTIPYELGIRGALVDLTTFDDFQETAAPYEPGFFMTGCIGDGIYSMPETMNFWVLYYRSDVLEKLELSVPETMDDVTQMLPELQMRGLNFYYATGEMLQLRNFHGTTPLIMQNGGSLYEQYASAGTALGSETSVEGFTQLTDLFTIYNVPINVDNFYQHFRNGDMPIGIADYRTYNLLKNAAPELLSSWEVALIPGIEKEDGTIERSVCGCAESTVIFKSDTAREQQAWEFTKWWSKAETQAAFGQTIQITYGDEYMWPTANMEAFAQLPWETGAREVIIETAANVVDIARVPGTYLLEREMSNAFNEICDGKETEQTRLDKAVKTINREIARKLEEFGYNDSEGNVITEYEISTTLKVRELLGRTEEKEVENAK